MDTRQLSMIIHDMKQPIDVMKSLIHFMALKANDMELERVCDLLEQNTNYLQRITNNIFEVAKNEYKVLDVKYASMDIERFAKLYIERIVPYLNEREIKLETEIDLNYGEFISDFDILSRILNDIVGNAVKYNNKQEKHLHISIKNDGDTVIFTVEDNGIGIPKDELPRVTECLYRASNGMKFSSGGCGLGLNLVSTLVDTLGGTLSIKSKLDVGTKVTVAIPSGNAALLAGGIAIIKALDKDVLDLVFNVPEFI